MRRKIRRKKFVKLPLKKQKLKQKEKHLQRKKNDYRCKNDAIFSTI